MKYKQSFHQGHRDLHSILRPQWSELGHRNTHPYRPRKMRGWETGSSWLVQSSEDPPLGLDTLTPSKSKFCYGGRKENGFCSEIIVLATNARSVWLRDDLLVSSCPAYWLSSGPPLPLPVWSAFHGSTISGHTCISACQADHGPSWRRALSDFLH